MSVMDEVESDLSKAKILIPRPENVAVERDCSKKLDAWRRPPIMSLQISAMGPGKSLRTPEEALEHR